MAKPNISLEVSDRDKKLLMMLLIILVLGAAYYFGYLKLSEKADKAESEYKALKRTEEDLLDKETQLVEYANKLSMYEAEYASIMSGFGSAVTQTSQIDFLNKVERVTGAWVKSVSFSAPAPVYTFGAMSSTNPAYPNRAAYYTDMTGYKTTLTLAYEAEYESWKSLIRYLNKYFSKNVIESISMNYSEITGEVSGTMSLAMYSVMGSDVSYVEPEFDVNTGSDNIFHSDILGNTAPDVNTGDYILAGYDYYIAITPYTSAVDTYTMGDKGATGDSLLSIKKEEEEKASFTVTGQGGNYKVRYELGDKSYEEEFKDAGSIELLIISSARVSEDDKAQIALTIENTSDTAVNIKVYNDDEKSRVRFENTKGNVVIY